MSRELADLPNISDESVSKICDQQHPAIERTRTHILERQSAACHEEGLEQQDYRSCLATCAA